MLWKQFLFSRLKKAHQSTAWSQADMSPPEAPAQIRHVQEKARARLAQAERAFEQVHAEH